MLLQYMRSEWFQNLFRPKAYSADTIPAGKHNKLPEFQEIFSQMKIHDMRGKHSELKRVGDGCRGRAILCLEFAYAMPKHVKSTR